MATEAYFRVDNVTKDFGEEFKLGPIDFSSSKGSTLGLLGKNGAGKSTLFKIITGNMDAGSGKVLIGDERMRPENHIAKKSIGYLPQDLSLPRWVTGQEILSYACRLYEFDDAKERQDTSLRYWDADWYAKRPLAACSHGMQKRIGLALASIHEPNLLILDEPFSGLDLFHIRALEDLIQKRGRDGKVTIVCTHIAPYAARLCDRILILDDGSLSELKAWKDKEYVDRIASIESVFFGATA